MRAAGGWIISTHFTLVPGRGGEPMISPHLKALRPFLRKGDFAPGAWGHALVDELAPVRFPDRENRLFRLLHDAARMGAAQGGRSSGSIVGGIVTNGGVASTVRDAHVRDFETVVLEDGCAAFDRATHETAIAALKPVARIATVADMLAEIGA